MYRKNKNQTSLTTFCPKTGAHGSAVPLAPVADWRAPRLAGLAAGRFEQRVPWPHDPCSKQQLDGRIQKIPLQEMDDGAFHEAAYSLKVGSTCNPTPRGAIPAYNSGDASARTMPAARVNSHIYARSGQACVRTSRIPSVLQTGSRTILPKPSCDYVVAA